MRGFRHWPREAPVDALGARDSLPGLRRQTTCRRARSPERLPVAATCTSAPLPPQPNLVVLPRFTTMRLTKAQLHGTGRPSHHGIEQPETRSVARALIPPSSGPGTASVLCANAD
eukprot:8897838-Heterocapsa_arctica.AAC.1